MKIAIIINTSWNIYNFRLGLIHHLINEGHQVLAIAPQDDYSDKLIQEGCTFEHVPMSGSGMNPFEDMSILYHFWSILKKERPDIVLAYTIKPNIYSSLVCRVLRIPIICNVSGLGTVFLWKGHVKKLVTQLYSIAFLFCSWVFFQNEEDQKDFSEAVKLNLKKTSVIPGSGVDVRRFKPVHTKNELPVFLMIARLLVEKGLIEYIEAIRILKKQGIRASFLLIGGLDEKHSRSIDQETLSSWIAEDLIEYHTHQEDIRSYIARADVVVLPSYREGTPRTLLEAGAMGKALIATNVPGCRQVVKDGKNGFLCKPRDPRDLASKMKLYLALSEEERSSMSRDSRQIIVDQFDERIIIEHYRRKIDELVKAV